MALIDRFTGEAGRRAVVQALRKQRLVAADQSLADEIAKRAEIVPFEKGRQILAEGGDDNDLYLILAGKVSIVRAGRSGPTRSAGDYFGELTLIDPSSVRSASVVAAENTVVARVSEPDFQEMSETRPEMWRFLAVEIGARLRQRLEDVPPRNATPVVFIGSSVEGLEIAECLQAKLEHFDAEVCIWKDGVFQASSTAIEDLELQVRSSDFAVLVVTEDDEVKSRGNTSAAPRDNVIFEMGMFVGALGRNRVFALKKRGIPIKLPTDLVGITPLEFDGTKPLDSALGPACRELKKRITEAGPK